ncbi:MAG: hypothetical protein MUD11_15945 [Rhodobacteraceae bacterium]|nr:hypothetical protein [Paracoccaceae bacterium]
MDDPTEQIRPPRHGYINLLLAASLPRDERKSLFDSGHLRYNIVFTYGKVLHDVTGGFSGKIQPDGSFLPDNGKPAYYLPGTEESGRFWWRVLAYVAGACVFLLLCWRAVKRYRARQVNVNESTPSGSSS